MSWPEAFFYSVCVIFPCCTLISACDMVQTMITKTRKPVDQVLEGGYT